MLKLPCGALAAALLTAALMSGAAAAGTSDFVGNWVNNDPGTQDVTRIVVIPTGGNNVKVRVFGQCQPTDCDWGTVPGHGYSDAVNSNDVRIITARFDPGFKKTLVILRLAPGGLRYQLLTEFTDGSGRMDYESGGRMNKVAFFPPLPLPHPMPAPGPGPGPMPTPHPMPMPHPLPFFPAMGPEDCISFNPMAVTTAHVGGAWKVVQGSMWMLDFGANQAAAIHAANVIHALHFDQQCFVKRPHAAMMYWKSGGHVPSNNMPGEDCIGNNPASTSVANPSGSWKVVDGAHWMLDYGPDKGAAQQALAVIKKYHLNRQCFIMRPNAEMSYWLSE
jgi:hypothetical protein